MASNKILIKFFKAGIPDYILWVGWDTIRKEHETLKKETTWIYNSSAQLFLGRKPNPDLQAVSKWMLGKYQHKSKRNLASARQEKVD